MEVSFREPNASPVDFAQNLDTVVLQASINSIANASITGHRNVSAKTNAIELDAQDITASLSRIQKLKFTGSSSSFSFTVNDGNSNTLTWKGLYNGPNFTYGIGEANFGTESTSLVSKLNQLRTDIYASTKEIKSTETTKSGDSIVSRIRKVLENLIKNFEADLNRSTTSGLDREMLLYQHQRNKEPLQIWYSILQNSQDNPKLVSKTYFALDQAIDDHIARIYLSNSADFFNTIFQFCNDFRLVYIPALNSASSATYGQLKGTSLILDANAVSKKVNIDTFSAVVRNFEEPPVNSVWVSGSGNSGIKIPSGLGSKIFGTWPKSANVTYDGTVRRIAPPAWVPAPQPLNVKVSSVPSSLLSSQASRVIETNTKELADINKINFDIFTEWARLAYLELKYGNESALISIPLDLSWQIGTLYKVTNDKGTLFTGLLSSVGHRLSTRDATTTLDFTHVQY